jgi:hypothetical protein
VPDNIQHTMESYDRVLTKLVGHARYRAPETKVAIAGVAMLTIQLLEDGVTSEEIRQAFAIWTKRRK